MITEKSLNNKMLQLEWVIDQETVNIMSELVAKNEKADSSAELHFYINDRVVAFATIENLETLSNSVVFDINLQACPIVFWVSVLIVTTNKDGDKLILTEEKKKFNLKNKFVSCGIQDKTSKIEPDFEWLGDLDNGVSLLQTNDLLTTWKQFKPFYWDDMFILSIVFEDYLINGSTFTLVEFFYDILFSNCYCVKHHGDWTGTTRGTTPKCVFDAPTAVVTNATGGTKTHTYIVVAVTPLRFLISQKTQVSSLVSLEENVKFVTLTWEAVSGATEYRIYRIITTTGSPTIISGLIGIVPTTYDINGDPISPATTYVDEDSSATSTYSSISYDSSTSHFYLKARRYKWKLTIDLPDDAGTATRTGFVTVTGG